MLLVFRCLFYMVLLAVFTLSLLPLDDDFVSTGWDKTNHLLAFFVLAALYDVAYRELAYWRIKCLVLFLFGLLIEVCQGFTSYRFFSLLDLIADGIGLLLFYPFRAYVAGAASWVLSRFSQGTESI